MSAAYGRCGNLKACTRRKSCSEETSKRARQRCQHVVNPTFIPGSESLAIKACRARLSRKNSVHASPHPQCNLPPLPTRPPRPPSKRTPSLSPLRKRTHLPNPSSSHGTSSLISAQVPEARRKQYPHLRHCLCNSSQIRTCPTPHSTTNPSLTRRQTLRTPADPANPYNWPQPLKHFTNLLTSLGSLLTLLSGPLATDLHLSPAQASLALSIYVLAFALGPLVLAPASEVWGRKVVWVAGGSWYVLWSAVCGVSRRGGVLVLGRAMAGVGASAESAVSRQIRIITDTSRYGRCVVLGV